MAGLRSLADRKRGSGGSGTEGVRSSGLAYVHCFFFSNISLGARLELPGQGKIGRDRVVNIYSMFEEANRE